MTRRKINISHKTKSTKINHAQSFVIRAHLICMSTVSNYTATVFIIYGGGMSRTRGACVEWVSIEFRPTMELPHNAPKLSYRMESCQGTRLIEDRLFHEIIFAISTSIDSVRREHTDQIRHFFPSKLSEQSAHLITFVSNYTKLRVSFARQTMIDYRCDDEWLKFAG